MERHQSSGDKLPQVAINLQNEMLMLCVRVHLHEEDKAPSQARTVGSCSRTGTEPSAMVGVLHNGGISTRFIYMIDA
jgi:hypothetical protein